MSHIEERELSSSEAAIVMCKYILEHGTISPEKAREITGRDKDAVLRVFRCMDRVMTVYREDDGRRTLVKGDER